MISDTLKDDIINFFRVSDTNKDGWLSRDEVGSVMARIKGEDPTKHEIDVCFAAMDTDQNGSVSEEEFCNVMMNWLQEVSKPQRKRRATYDIMESPSALTRKKAVSEIANFFKQFCPVDNFQKEQMLILARNRDTEDVTFLQREYGAMSTELKAEKYEEIRTILTSNRTDIISSMMALDWKAVMTGVAAVSRLLSVVELFHSSQDKYADSTSQYFTHHFLLQV
jgi:hypothetical protein